jgi:DNA uptake protein ComE-like DNA-binding protein
MNVNKLKFHLKEYFTFSKGEKAGILVLLSLLILVLAGSSLLSHMVPDHPNVDVSKFDKEITQFEEVTDSITVAQKAHGKTSNKYHEKREHTSPPAISIELNNADSSALDQLPGIGPVFAARIIKYRTLLGGYYSVDQLSEVYGMKPETVLKLRKFLTVDTTQIQKIDLNKATFKQINSHPYISFEQTKAICKYRVHNNILSFKQLENLQFFTSNELEKIRPYLMFNL